MEDFLSKKTVINCLNKVPQAEEHHMRGQVLCFSFLSFNCSVFVSGFTAGKFDDGICLKAEDNRLSFRFILYSTIFRKCVKLLCGNIYGIKSKIIKRKTLSKGNFSDFE